MSGPIRRCGMGALLASVVSCACGDREVVAPREPALPGMVRIPAGTFVFGCDRTEPECPAHEQPRRSVRLPAFQIGLYEVTEGDYAACVKAGACAADGLVDDSRHPYLVDTIAEARTYCAWRGLRLPTSIEWEKAARGTDGRPFPWGSEAPDCDRAAFCTRQVHDELFFAMGEVGRHPRSRSPYGVEDMAGNAPEWTECPPGLASCGAIVRSFNFSGEDGLRTYAGLVTEPALAFPQPGFRCAK